MTEIQETMAPPPPADTPLLDIEHLSKSFGNVRAVIDVSIRARRGEITAIVGDNGAGKSTLIRCVVGIHRADGGRIVLDGRPVNFGNPEDARRAGIETVHQNLALVEDLTVWQNLFLNRERVRRFGPVALLARATMQRESRDMLARLAVNVPSVRARVRRLSGGQRQAVALARAASWGSKLVIMDEPTAALGVQETAKVEELILRLRDEGLGVVLISHNFDQVMRLSDQIWVMRSGRLVGGRRTDQTSGDELVGMITGTVQT